MDTNEGGNRAEWVRAALERYERPLLRYAAGITGDLESARDVVQDTFLRLCTAERVGIEDRLAAWLYTVCRNRALDVLRKERHMKPLREGQAEAVASGGAGPRTVASWHEAHGLVLETLETLPTDQQEAFRLKFNDELTYREISQVMGKSLGTVSNLIGTALNAVRHRLIEKLGTVPACETGLGTSPSSQEG